MATWADNLIEQLTLGETVTATPRGHSMTPIITSGQTVTIRPLLEDDQLKRGDIVLVKMSVRTVYLHKISATEGQRRFQISNNRGQVNGWVNRSSIYGVYVS